jgi:2-phosphoxylose phosphatase
VPDSQAAQIAWSVSTSDSNPFAPSGFNGSCQFPQITAQGLNDSRQHGRDLYGVYGDLLNFLPSQFDSAKVQYRVTNNVITSQVAGQVVLGMYPSTSKSVVQVSIQPSSIDSLEPNYDCTAADSLYSEYSISSNAANWTLHLNLSTPLFSKLDSVSKVNESDPDWHNWFDHYFDNLSSRLCHQKPLPCSPTNNTNCITQSDANAVFRRGEYEYSYIYRDHSSSLAASTASFGVWMAELASNIRSVINGSSEVIYRHNVAHDGSISRLLSILQIDVMVWPGMGSEVVFEIYKRQKCFYLRVLWSGSVLTSSNPWLGRIDMVPMSKFLRYIDGLVGLRGDKVPGLCEEA